jgi:uncharacterized protein (TIGR02391 family)
MFVDGHFSPSILQSLIALEVRVRAQSAIASWGKNLMARALADDGPVQLAHETGTSGNDEQEGFKLLFMGAMQAIRDPKAHGFVREPSAQRTLEYLTATSLMFRRLDDAVHGLATTDAAMWRLVADRIEAELPGSAQARVEGTITYPSSGVPPATIVLYGGPGMGRGQMLSIDDWSPRPVPFVFDSVMPGQYSLVAYAELDHASMVGTVAPEAGAPGWFTVDSGSVVTDVVIEAWSSTTNSPPKPMTIEPGYELLA